MPKPLRVGTVPYLVGRPLDTGLGDEPGIELVRAVPAKLVEGLREGRLDVALVSSIELFRRPGYRYIDGLAVAGRGTVGSVQMFLRQPLAEVRRIALDPVSRAAAALVKTLLHEGSTVRPADAPPHTPEFLEVPLGVDPEDAEADAWLRIGDEALRAALAPDAPPTFNPSAAWTRTTGLPFVFAVWIVRAEVEIEPHVGAFMRSRKRGRTALDELVQEASEAWSLPAEACHRYLAEECLYEPGAELGTALEAFRDAAAPFSLCDGSTSPEAIQPTEHVP
jgi:chorismate dehydratase